jgi:hypothetical protein
VGQSSAEACDLARLGACPRPGRSHLAAGRTTAPWVPVEHRHPKSEVALPGYVWLDMPAKARHVQVRELEFTDQPLGQRSTRE